MARSQSIDRDVMELTSSLLVRTSISSLVCEQLKQNIQAPPVHKGLPQICLFAKPGQSYSYTLLHGLVCGLREVTYLKIECCHDLHGSQTFASGMIRLQPEQSVMHHM